MTLKTTLLSIAIASATALPAAATPFVTGIGFGTERSQAMSHMVIAWTQGAFNTYGTANWNLATRGPVSCVQLQPQSGAYTTNDATPGADIYTFGDIASAKWSCTVEAAMR